MTWTLFLGPVGGGGGWQVGNARRACLNDACDTVCPRSLLPWGSVSRRCVRAGGLGGGAVYVTIGGNVNVEASQVAIDGVVASNNMADVWGVGGGGGAVAATITALGAQTLCAIAVSNCVLSENYVTGTSAAELGPGHVATVLGQQLSACVSECVRPLPHAVLDRTAGFCLPGRCTPV